MYVYVHCSKTDKRRFERKFNVLINYLAVIIRNLNYPKDQFLQAIFMILLPTSKSPFQHYANVLSNMKFLFFLLIRSFLKICESTPSFRFHGFKFAKSILFQNKSTISFHGSIQRATRSFLYFHHSNSIRINELYT